MTFLRNHWYDLGVIPMSLTALYLALNWETSLSSHA